MLYFSLDNRVIIVYLAAFLLLSYTLTPPPLPALQRNTPSFLLLGYTTTTTS
ncbi:BnaCnng15510D [Brassica napus]|uniref:(rape) hypothetical protein n=1 Tax=Brassica napus TaxID=3708 RepID=A0A078IA16_BRANA|nr:unnamed protein product [Brassica napus]CDY47760.1 BnaCnng15510D [Brassica napus]